jgi:hypothetical protein
LQFSESASSTGTGDYVEVGGNSVKAAATVAAARPADRIDLFTFMGDSNQLRSRSSQPLT